MTESANASHIHRLNHGLINLRGFYLVSGLIWGCLGPYIVSWFAADGMSTKEAGVIIAVATLVALVFQPFLGVTVDRYGTGKLILLLSVIVPAVLSLAFNSRSFIVLLIVYSLATIFRNIQAPVSDAYAISVSNHLKIAYGTIRSFGSLGMALGGFLGGLFVSHFTVQRLWMPIMLLSAACLLHVLTLDDDREKKIGSTPFLKDMHLILANRKFLFFLLGCLLVNQTLPAFDSYFVVAFESAGGSFSLAGVGLLIASLTNIPAMLIASRVIHRIGLEGALLLASAFYVLRWSLQIVSVLAFNPIVMLLIQGLHGLSFGIFYVTAVQYVARISGDKLLATGQSIFNMVFIGLCGIIGNLLNGYLFGLGGPLLMYSFCAISTLLGTFCLYLNSSARPNSR